MIQWWSLNGSWNFNQQVYTSNMVLHGIIDDVRVFPSDAQLVTYTYLPLVGKTSEMDPNGKTTYYEYDEFQRLKNIKDYQGNITKNFQYNYANSCGPNCSVLPMQTFNGTATISYPVGVFNINGKLLGNATTQSQYISVWTTDTADSHTGSLAVGTDSMHFNFTVNSGRVVPSAMTGCRYYQFDLSYNLLDGVRNFNGSYVDFGDGKGMHLGKTTGDTPVVLAPNTTVVTLFGYFSHIPYNYYIHTYPDTTKKTITFYHNDANESQDLDNVNGPGTSLTLLKNIRGNLPQFIQLIGGSGYQQTSAQTVANITNWNGINSITEWSPGNGDGVNPSKNLNYSQDFMINNRGLQKIRTSIYGFYRNGYRDTTFKISRLKSDWNTYFTQLQVLAINEDHWNRENLTALPQLNFVAITATTQNHQDDSNSPLIPILSPEIDNIINQVAAGAGQTVTNGLINIASAGGIRTTASDTSVNLLKSKGWSITVNGVLQ